MADVGEHGQGTVVELPNGRFQVAVTMADGRRVWRRARTGRQAEKVRRELVDRRERDLDPSAQTLADFLRSWLASLSDGRRIRRRTLDHYTMIAEKHIIPALGKRRLEQLSERHVQAWLDADTAAPQTVAHHRAVLRRALNVALRQRAVVRNAALAVELPVVRSFTGSPLTEEETIRLLRVTADDRLGILWRLAIDSGLRQGELLGLAWDDIGTGTVTVSMQLQRIDQQWRRTPTKAARTLGTLTITGATARALTEHRVRQAVERRPDWEYWGLVFVTSNGQPYHGAEILKAFHRACDRSGITRRRFHDLRATSATLQVQVGVSEEVRMARLGHATKDMARHYAQVRGELDRDAARRMEAILGG